VKDVKIACAPDGFSKTFLVHRLGQYHAPYVSEGNVRKNASKRVAPQVRCNHFQTAINNDILPVHQINYLEQEWVCMQEANIESLTNWHQITATTISTRPPMAPMAQPMVAVSLRENHKAAQLAEEYEYGHDNRATTADPWW
jgi:hypothetical protein